MSKPITTTPLLIIIAICYNAEAIITPTLHSLTGQRGQSFEYLIIDGAPQDKVLSLVQTLYPRVIVHSEPDHGLYDMMNKGLHQVHGTYIWCLSAGDTLRMSGTVRAVCAALEMHQPDLFYGNTMVVNGAYQDLHPCRLCPPHQLTQRPFVNGMFTCHQAFVPRRSLTPLYNLHYRYLADYDQCIKIISVIHGQYHIGDHLVNYLNKRVTIHNHRASLLERLRIMARRYGWFTTLTQYISFLFYRQR